MSDVRASPQPQQPAAPAAEKPDPLAGDWSEGLPGPIRAHGLPLPARLGDLSAAAVAAPASNGASLAAPPEAEALRPPETPWSQPVEPSAGADGWAMSPPATEDAANPSWTPHAHDAGFAPVSAPPPDASAAGAGEPQAWQQSTEASPWSGPAQPATEWDPNAPAPTADQWAAPAEAPESAQEWSAGESAADPARALGPSSAVPDEGAWSAPPPAEGEDLSPEPPDPAWTQQGRPDLAPLAAGESLAAEEEDGPHALADHEAAALLRPVDDSAASGLLPPSGDAANDAPSEEPVSLLHPPGDLDPAMQPIMDPTLQPVADGESVVLLHPSDHPDLPAPVDENAPPMVTGGRQGSAIVPGEHRVAIHTRGGSTRRGSVTDLDLARPQFPLQPQGGGSTEIVPHSDVKAIFFMLAPGEVPVRPDGGKVRVTLSDGRSLEGHRDGADGPQGFFLVPVDAQKTNTKRIYVARAAVSAVTDL